MLPEPEKLETIMKTVILDLLHRSEESHPWIQNESSEDRIYVEDEERE